MKKINLVCVVDDDQIYNFTIKRIINRSDVAEKTIFFHNGQAALEYLTENINAHEELPNVILLDLNMPVLDGWQFLNEFIKLRPALTKKITIYIVSSSIDDADFQRAKEIEAVSDFFVKPLSEKDLVGILEHLNNVA